MQQTFNPQWASKTPITILKRSMETENKQTAEAVLQKFMCRLTRLDKNKLLAVSPALRECLKELLAVSETQEEVEETANTTSQAFISLPCALALEDVWQIEVELPKGL